MASVFRNCPKGRYLLSLFVTGAAVLVLSVVLVATKTAESLPNLMDIRDLPGYVRGLQSDFQNQVAQAAIPQTTILQQTPQTQTTDTFSQMHQQAVDQAQQFSQQFAQDQAQQNADFLSQQLSLPVSQPLLQTTQQQVTMSSPDAFLTSPVTAPAPISAPVTAPAPISAPVTAPAPISAPAPALAPASAPAPVALTKAAAPVTNSVSVSGPVTKSVYVSVPSTAAPVKLQNYNVGTTVISEEPRLFRTSKITTTTSSSKNFNPVIAPRTQKFSALLSSQNGIRLN